MARANIIGLLGSLTRPSRTTTLVAAILDRLSGDGDVRLIERVDEAPHLFAARPRGPLAGRTRSSGQLRPLFGFFGVLTLPTAVYALERDFDGHALASATVRERIDRSVAEARHQLRHLTPASRTPMRHAAQA